MVAGRFLLFDSYHAFTTWGYNCVCCSLWNGLAVGSQNVDFLMQTTTITLCWWNWWKLSRKEIMNCLEKRIRSKSLCRTLVRSAKPPTKFIRHGNRLIIINIKHIPQKYTYCWIDENVSHIKWPKNVNLSESGYRSNVDKRREDPANSPYHKIERFSSCN